MSMKHATCDFILIGIIIQTKKDIAMVIHRPLVNRDSEVIVTCYSDFDRTGLIKYDGVTTLEYTKIFTKGMTLLILLVRSVIMETLMLMLLSD